MEIEDLTVEKYEWGDKILTVRENKIIHKKLQSDSSYASRYFTKFVGPKDVDEEKSKISSEEEIFEDHIWSHDAVKLLISEYKSRLDRFNNPEVKNILLWKEIADVFREENKPYPVYTISRKFCNMKSTYYKTIRNKRRVKIGRRPWPWTKAMEEILGKDNPKVTHSGIRTAKKKNSYGMTDLIESTNVLNNEEMARNNNDVLNDEDNWDIIDDTSNFSSSFENSSDHDNSRSSQNLLKDISDYRRKMLDLKKEEIKILKLIHKDVDGIHYSRMEIVSELIAAIKEHTDILKEFANVLEERFFTK